VLCCHKLTYTIIKALRFTTQYSRQMCCSTINDLHNYRSFPFYNTILSRQVLECSFDNEYVQYSCVVLPYQADTNTKVYLLIGQYYLDSCVVQH
jgi:hypothetical protein